MADHPNAELVRRGYAAFSAGDIATMNELFAEDVAWHWPGNHPVSGEHRGRDAVFAAFMKFAELSGGTLKLEVHDVVANDEHAVALTHVTASRGGKRLDMLGADVFHIAGGKVSEGWGFAEDQRLDDEFWS